MSSAFGVRLTRGVAAASDEKLTTDEWYAFLEPLRLDPDEPAVDEWPAVRGDGGIYKFDRFLGKKGSIGEIAVYSGPAGPEFLVKRIRGTHRALQEYLVSEVLRTPRNDAREERTRKKLRSRCVAVRWLNIPDEDDLGGAASRLRRTVPRVDFDDIADDDLHFMAMQTLTGALDVLQRMEPLRAVDAAVCVGRLLRRFWRLGVCYLDLKPENVLYLDRGRDATIKVVMGDLGGGVLVGKDALQPYGACTYPPPEYALNPSMVPATATSLAYVFSLFVLSMALKARSVWPRLGWSVLAMWTEKHLPLYRFAMPSALNVVLRSICREKVSKSLVEADDNTDVDAKNALEGAVLVGFDAKDVRSLGHMCRLLRSKMSTQPEPDSDSDTDSECEFDNLGDTAPDRSVYNRVDTLAKCIADKVYENPSKYAQIKVILQEGKTDVMKPSGNLWSAFLTAVHTGDTDALALMEELKIPMDVNARAPAKLFAPTALSVALDSGSTKTIKWMLRQPGIDVDARDSNGAGAIHYAAFDGNDGALRALVENGGADVNSRVYSDLNTTPLMIAVTNRRHYCIDFLLKCPGIDVNARDSNGYTALMKAARLSEHIVRTLLDVPGIDLTAKNNARETAEVCARKAGNLAIAKLIRDKVEKLKK